MREEHTHNLYMDDAIERAKCTKHGAERGEPCWVLKMGEDYILRAVCDRRARNAGFRGTVTPVEPPRKKRQSEQA